MTKRRRSPGRRAVLGALALVATGVAVFGVLAPPERCPTVTADALEASAREAVDWFVRNQAPDGRWLYQYDVGADIAADDYNVIRHSGAAMGLYQAATAGIPGALESADRGLEWSLQRLVEKDDWAAVTSGGETPVGATALLVAGLAERRQHTGDTRYDQVLQQMGRFLVTQTEPSGAVLSHYDASAGRPVPGAYSKYYTGETYWALARLHRLFPDGGWGEAADRIGAYVATDRDDVEDYWPPLPDHWAAYGLSETVAFDDRPADQPLTADEADLARRQSELFGAQARWVSQRFGPWGRLVRGPHVPRGGGYGVMGEALTGLWLAAEADPRLHDLRAPIAERATCVAGLAVSAQTDADEARDHAAPDRTQGAWLRDGGTRMDDQQHALSALLRTIPIVERAAADAEDSSGTAPSAWLWLLALIAAFNPFRVALGVPRGERSRHTVTVVAAAGGAIGGLIALVIAVASAPLLDVADVSDPALRIAAGGVAAVAGVVAMVRRPPSPEPSLPGWRASLVPVALPLVASPALVVLSLSARADGGLAVVAGAILVGAMALTLLVRFAPTGGPGGRVVAWAGRVTAASLVVASVLLLVDGIFDV